MSVPEEVVRSRPIFTVVPLARILAGQRHVPVVYFAHMGFIQKCEVVKIGTTKNLQARMRELYVPLGNVLAVVPGDREIEDGYHRLFAEYQVNHRMREMFRLAGRLERFLSSQAEGACDDLPPCVPTLMQSAARGARAAAEAFPLTSETRPMAQADPSAPMSLWDIVAAGLVPCSVRALRQDRYRSDHGQLPGDLKFPKPALVDGQTERFWSADITAFNAQRRGTYQAR